GRALRAASARARRRRRSRPHRLRSRLCRADGRSSSCARSRSRHLVRARSTRSRRPRAGARRGRNTFSRAARVSPVNETLDFGAIVLVVAVGFAVAVALSKVTERFPVPGPALFLLAAAIASDVFPGLTLPIRSVERIGVVALVVILFEGGMQ